MLMGCATAPSYQANATDPSQGAILRAWTSGQWAFFTYTQIEKVDGLHLSIWSQSGSGSLVDPGVRTLNAAGTYVGGFGGRDTGRVELTATLKPGHTYVLKAERSANLMTLWIEDQQTHEAASERKATSTTHWILWW
jgi:hypothetical protein